jgi:hypothetical protein
MGVGGNCNAQPDFEADAVLGGGDGGGGGKLPRCHAY